MKFRALLLPAFAVVLALLALAPAAQAFRIEPVTSPGGVKAWLVQDKTIPLIAIKFSFRGGSVLDPAGKEGTADFITGMMDEGAGDLDSQAFQKLRDELSFKMGFDAQHDRFEGSFQTLTRNSAAAFALLRKVLSAPRFDADPLERVRRQLALGIADRLEDPEHIASAAWFAMMLPGDAYSREASGTPSSIARITADDLRQAHRRIFNRTTLQVAVVGDIDARRLATVLDEVFGGLPLGAEPPPPPRPEPIPGPALKIVARDIPQSIVVFGLPGIKRDDADFFPAYLMAEILGGGFGSRLTAELREKRGLTYGVGAALAPMARLGLYIGSLATRNEKAGEAIAVLRREIRRMADEGPTEKELAEAKTYQTGSYALRFDSNVAIASQLLGIQQENLGIDYIESRNARVEAVTLEQVKAQARRLLAADRLVIAVVGKPEGLTD